MVHHPATIKGLHAKHASQRSADLGKKHSSPPTHPDALQLGEKPSDGSHELCSTFGTRIAKWFDDRQITQNGTLDGQFAKLREEVSELDQGMNDNDLEEMKDAIGDCAVVLAGIAHMLGMSFEQCCEHAWNEIKDRTGHLNEEGIFVKDLVD